RPIEAFSEKDFTGDFKKFDVPTPILRGDDDQKQGRSRRSSESVTNVRDLPDPEWRHLVSKIPASARHRPCDQRAKLLWRVCPPDRLAPIQHIHSRQAQRPKRAE